MSFHHSCQSLAPTPARPCALPWVRARCPHYGTFGLLLLFAVALNAGAAAAPGTGDAAPEAAAADRDRVVLPTPPPGPVPTRAVLNRLIDRIADRHGLERALVHAVVRAESAYDPHAVSPAGAVGLMQVMPATAADYGVASVQRLFDPATNVRTGVRHLRRLVRKYGIGKAVMAYNAGEGTLERSNGFVTYAETQRYTHRVLTTYLAKKGIAPYTMQARQLTGITLTQDESC
jgi:soluble lytic murein transglycosylase-like protein